MLSTITSCWSRSVRTRCGSAPGLSILLMATMRGTSAALAWLMASTVCGITPSSAATTSTTMSVTLAPRARMAVNASWPGVSMKVTSWPLGRRHLVGADVLGDAAGLALGHVGLADGVEQRGLAVVDVAHDGDDRRPRQLVLVGVGRAREALLDVGFGHALGRVAELAHDQLGGIGVDRVVDLVHRALAHQEPDHIDGALRHAVGEVLDGDHLGNNHLAHDFVSRLLDAGLFQLLALAPAAQRGERALALRFVEGVVDGELAALAALLAHARRGLGDLGALLLAARIVLRLGGLHVELALGDGLWAAHVRASACRPTERRRSDPSGARAWRRPASRRRGLGRSLGDGCRCRRRVRRRCLRLALRRLGGLPGGFLAGTLRLALGRLGLLTLLGDLQGTAARVDLAGRQPAGAPAGTPRRARPRRGRRWCASSSSRRQPTSSGHG